jgi:hypothetical protein
MSHESSEYRSALKERGPLSRVPKSRPNLPRRAYLSIWAALLPSNWPWQGLLVLSDPSPALDPSGK